MRHVAVGAALLLVGALGGLYAARVSGSPDARPVPPIKLTPPAAAMANLQPAAGRTPPPPLPSRSEMRGRRESVLRLGGTSATAPATPKSDASREPSAPLSTDRAEASDERDDDPNDDDGGGDDAGE